MEQVENRERTRCSAVPFAYILNRFQAGWHRRLKSGAARHDSAASDDAYTLSPQAGKGSRGQFGIT
jgi:hypothetical protein